MAPRPAPTLPPRQSTGGSSVAISGLRFEAANRFLNAKGETVRLYLTLLGPQGQPLSPEVQAALPIEWLSTRPQDLSVDAQGFVKALVEEGFSTIIARVPGSTYEAQTLFSVSSGRSGGGGGGGGGSSGGGVSAALNPVIQSLSVSQTQVLGAGAVVRLDAQASYNGSGLGNGDYRWSCIPADCGSFSPASGPTVYWQAPAQSGSYTLQLTASNGSQSASQSLTVSVSVGTETIQVNS